jgi:hypothetical protein
MVKYKKNMVMKFSDFTKIFFFYEFTCYNLFHSRQNRSSF